MPIYEYKCNSCGKVSSVFFRSFSDVSEPPCPSCNSADMRKLMSRPFIVKSEAERFAAFDQSKALGRLDSPFDPAAKERWARDVSRSLPGEMGAEFREMAEQMSSEDGPPEMYDPGYYLQSRLNAAQMEAQGMKMDENSGGWVDKSAEPSPDPYA